MRADPEALAQALAELVQIPSVNPLHAGPIARAHGPIGELALAQRLAQGFADSGAEQLELDEISPGRPNIYAQFPGRTQRLVLVDVHTDTVSVENMAEHPFAGWIASGSVWGRGALDSKASLAVLLVLLSAWHRAGLRPEPTLLVAGTASEEAGGLLGATRLRAWIESQGRQVDQILVAEPTQFRPVHGLQGLVLVDVKVRGVSAHSASPELGSNAVEAMSAVIAAFVAENERLQRQPAATELGSGTVSVTQISGGTGSNVIPDRCSITVGRRIVPGENPAAVLADLTQIAQQACPLPCAVTSLLPPTVDGAPASPAFYQHPTTPLVQRLADLSGTTSTVGRFGANALKYSGLAPQIAIFGPGAIEDAHQATERVAISDLVRLAAIFTRWLAPA